MADYAGRRRKPSLRATVAAVGSFVLLTLIAAALTEGFSKGVARLTSEPPAPKVYLVERGAKVGANSMANFAGIVVPMVRPMPTPTSRNDIDLEQWAVNLGGTAATGTGYELQITAPDGTTSIVGVGARVLKRSPAVTGAFIGPSGAGDNFERVLDINFDGGVVGNTSGAWDDWTFPISLGKDDTFAAHHR